MTSPFAPEKLDGWDECTRCGGEGLLPHPEDPTELIDCPDCDGLGEVAE